MVRLTLVPRISSVPELAGAWREMLVSELDLDAARELLASPAE